MPLQEGRRFGIQTPEETQQRLLQAWQTFIATPITKHTPDYHEAERIIQGLRYRAKDIEQLSRVLPVSKGKLCFAWHAGLFFSALINHGKDRDYVIHTRDLRQPDALGFFNTKNIRVEGNVGMWLGEFMKSGIILVNGNASDLVGEGMENGHILVYGRAGNEIAQYMKAGTITVKDGLGDPWSMVGGYSEKAARVFIEGGECPIRHPCGDLELYHLGKLVNH